MIKLLICWVFYPFLIASKSLSIKDFRSDQSEKWGIGNIKIEDHQLNQVKDQLDHKSQYKSKEQYKEENDELYEEINKLKKEIKKLKSENMKLKKNIK